VKKRGEERGGGGKGEGSWASFGQSSCQFA